MARAGDAAAGGDRSGDAAAAAVEQFDVVRPEIERGLAVGTSGAARPMVRSATHNLPSSTVTGSELDSPMKP